jgi:hypothetical protein
MTQAADPTPTPPTDAADARREFIRRYGKLAIAAPAVGLLLSTTLASPAIAHSGGHGHKVSS